MRATASPCCALLALVLVSACWHGASAQPGLQLVRRSAAESQTCAAALNSTRSSCSALELAAFQNYNSSDQCLLRPLRVLAPSWTQAWLDWQVSSLVGSSMGKDSLVLVAQPGADTQKALKLVFMHLRFSCATFTPAA